MEVRAVLYSKLSKFAINLHLTREMTVFGKNLVFFGVKSISFVSMLFLISDDQENCCFIHAQTSTK